jgi:hypothetical protein
MSGYFRVNPHLNRMKSIHFRWYQKIVTPVSDFTLLLRCDGTIHGEFVAHSQNVARKTASSTGASG